MRTRRSPGGWLLHSGLGLDAHHPDGGPVQCSQGHRPPTTISRAPTSTVRGVLCTPIVAAYTIPNGYISTAAPAHKASAHLGSYPEEHVAHEQEYDDHQGR